MSRYKRLTINSFSAGGELRFFHRKRKLSTKRVSLIEKQKRFRSKQFVGVAIVMSWYL